MKAARPRGATRLASHGAELAKLRGRLEEAEATLQAIRMGEIDAVVVAGKRGPRVFTLEGAEHAYRILIESMHEGALTLTSDMMVLYANQCFARMVRYPLNRVIGRSIHTFFAAAEKASMSRLLASASVSGKKARATLLASDGSQVPAQVSMRQLPRGASGHATIGLVVTDMTEARRTEEILRALTDRAIQARETDRGRLALDLHDNITQLLCGILVRSQVLASKLASHGGSAKADARELGRMLGVAATEVERISQELRPSVLEHLGLEAVLHGSSTRFACRTGIPVRMSCVELPTRLAPDTELVLLHILEESLSNVSRHARARRVTVMLTQPGSVVRLSITDDGRGFDPRRSAAGRKRVPRLGLLGMRERAMSVGGDLSVNSVRGKGTIVRVRVPFPGRRGAGLVPVNDSVDAQRQRRRVTDVSRRKRARGGGG